MSIQIYLVYLHHKTSNYMRYTKEELNQLEREITTAERNFHNAVCENLKNGKVYKVRSDNEEDEEEENCDGLRVTIIGRHDSLVELVVDAIKYGKDFGTSVSNYGVKIHVAREDYKKCDTWYPIYICGSTEVTYIYSQIEWET